MRIITGSARGTKLETLDGLETRPTAERVKEALFSMIQFEIENRSVLDLFAGSGQLGLEALSRGAKTCTFVEKSVQAMGIVKKNAGKTRLSDRCVILNADWADFLRGAANRQKYDIVFLDPPYSQKIIPDILKSLVVKNVLNPNAIVVCESEEGEDYSTDGLEIVKQNKYGRVFITLLRKTNEGEKTEI